MSRASSSAPDVSALRDQLERRLGEGDLPGAFAVLEPHVGALSEDREFAWLFLDLLSHAPERATLLEETERVLNAFPDDVALVLAACDALSRAAERFPMDAPPLTEDGPAQRAAAAAARCLEALPESERARKETAGYLWINRANALRRAGPDRDAEAQEAYANALEIDPDNGHWWFDLGVLHKWRGPLSGRARLRSQGSCEAGGDESRSMERRDLRDGGRGWRSGGWGLESPRHAC